jgi:hypothetical protein
MAVETYMIAALVTGVAGTVLSAQAQRQQTKAERARLKYNAALAQQKADEERRIGKLKTESERKKARRIQSSQRAGYAKGGVIPIGTPAKVMTETAKNQALNALLVGRESEITAQAYESQGSMFDIQSVNAKKAGRLAVGAELFGGIGSTIQTYSAYKSLKKKKE